MTDAAHAVPRPTPTAADSVRAVALWALGLAWLVAGLSTLFVLQLFVAPDRLDRLNRLYTRGQIALTFSRWRAVVDPAVDPATPYLFAQNHTNHFDHVLLYEATPHFKQGLELEAHFSIPFYGWFMRQRGTIPVRRGDKGQSPALREAVRAEVAKGHSILVVPEGTRTRTGRVGPFRRGLFYVARDLGLPVVPVAVTGALRLMRQGDWRLRPADLVVHVLAPIPTAGLSDAEVDALADRVRDLVAAKIDAEAA